MPRARSSARARKRRRRRPTTSNASSPRPQQALDAIQFFKDALSRAHHALDPCAHLPRRAGCARLSLLRATALEVVRFLERTDASIARSPRRRRAASASAPGPAPPGGTASDDARIDATHPRSSFRHGLSHDSSDAAATRHPPSRAQRSPAAEDEQARWSRSHGPRRRVARGRESAKLARARRSDHSLGCLDGKQASVASGRRCGPGLPTHMRRRAVVASSMSKAPATSTARWRSVPSRSATRRASRHARRGGRRVRRPRRCAVELAEVELAERLHTIIPVRGARAAARRPAPTRCRRPCASRGPTRGAST